MKVGIAISFALISAVAVSGLHAQGARMSASLDGDRFETWKAGHDFTAVTAAVSRANVVRRTDQFLSSDERLQAVKTRMDTAIAPGTDVRLSDLLAFHMLCRINPTGVRALPCSARYDPDQEKFAVRFERDTGGSSDEFPVVVLADSKRGAPFVGQNAYGVRRTVRTEIESMNVLNLQVVERSEVLRQVGCAVASKRFGWALDFGIGFDVPVPRSIAASIPVYLDVLFVGHLREPFYSYEELDSTPTVADPIQITFKRRVLHLRLQQVVIGRPFEKTPIAVFDMVKRLPCNQVAEPSR